MWSVQRCPEGPEGVQKMSRRCPEDVQKVSRRLEKNVGTSRESSAGVLKASGVVQKVSLSQVNKAVGRTCLKQSPPPSEQPSQSWAMKSRHCGLLVKACGPSGHSGHLLKLAKAPSGHSGHLLKLAISTLWTFWTTGAHSRRRACWEDSVITAAWSLGGRRDRSSRAGLGLAALAHLGFV